jgi:hypothetical protein
MQWDLGLQGVAVLVAMSLGFGVLAGLLVGRDLDHRLRWAAVTWVACFAVGLFTSEVWFGWADEEELQPNYDGLSFDEVLLSGVVTTALVVLVARRVARRTETGSGHHRAPGTPHLLGPRH